MRDLASNISSAQAIAPALRTTGLTGTAVDGLGFQSVAYIVHVGAWTDGAHAVSFEHSTDNAEWDAVAATDLVGTAPTIEGDGESPEAGTFATENVVIGYIGNRRYTRPKITVSGAPGTGAFIGIDAVLGHPLNAPA